MTKNYYRIQGAPTNSIVTATRTGSTVSLTATAEALMFLNLPIDTEFIMNPRSKRQFRKISDFADAFIIDLEALPDYVPPTDDIQEPADGELALTEPTEPTESMEEDWEAIADDSVGEQAWEKFLEAAVDLDEALADSDDLSEIAFSDELEPADDEPSILDPDPGPEELEPVEVAIQQLLALQLGANEPASHAPTAELADDDDEPALPDMTSLELRKFSKTETIRLGRTADILATGWIVKGKLRHGAAKHWLPKPIFLENALVTKIGNKWIFFKANGAEYFATETEGMVYRSQ